MQLCCAPPHSPAISGARVYLIGAANSIAAGPAAIDDAGATIRRAARRRFAAIAYSVTAVPAIGRAARPRLAIAADVVATVSTIGGAGRRILGRLAASVPTHGARRTRTLARRANDLRRIKRGVLCIIANDLHRTAKDARRSAVRVRGIVFIVRPKPPSGASRACINKRGAPKDAVWDPFRWELAHRR